MKRLIFIIGLAIWAGCISSPPSGAVANSTDGGNGVNDTKTAEEVGGGDGGSREDFAIPPADGGDWDLPPEGRTVTLRFRDGEFPTRLYAGTRDLYLSSSSPDEPHGDDQSLRTDTDDTVLIYWDIGAIPSGVTVKSARIDLVADREPDNIGGPSNVYVVLTSWDEVTATWYERSAGVPWQEDGCRGANEVGPLLGTLDVPTPGSALSIESPALVQTVQQWVSAPQTNNGVGIFTSESIDSFRVYSRETDATEDRPTLTVEFGR